MPDEAETGLLHEEHEGTAETASEREVNRKAGSNLHAQSSRNRFLYIVHLS